jgi:hypothetical protein
MTTFFYAETKDGEYIFDNLPSEFKLYYNSFLISEQYSKQNIFLNGQKKTIIQCSRKSKEYLLYIVTHDSKFLNKIKLFKDYADFLFSSIKSIHESKTNMLYSLRSSFVHDII